MPLRPSVITALVAVLLLSGCGGGGGWDQPPPLVEVTSVGVQPWQVTYRTSGTLEADQVVDLNAESPGIITALPVKEGQAVRRGQVLLRLKADKVLAQVSEASASVGVSQESIGLQEAQLRQAEARIKAARQRLNLADFERQRFERLHKSEFVSQLELEQKRTAYETADADFEEAQEQVSAARASLAQAQANLVQSRSGLRYSQAVANENVILAPFSGLVGRQFVDPGDYVAPTEKLLTLVDPSSLRVVFDVPERYLGALNEGLPVAVEFEGLPEKVFAAKISFIDPVVDAESRTLRVKALVSDSTSHLRHGMFGHVGLSLGTLENAVVIPEEAIVPQGEKSFVFVVDKDANASLREIHVGHREAGRVHVASGLQPGDRVIVSGQQKVTDGMTVNPGGGKPSAAGKKRPAATNDATASDKHGD